VFGVPLPLVSPDTATYSNMESARAMLYENTVIPLAERFYDQLVNYIEPNKYEVSINLDAVSALSVSRKDRAEQLSKLVNIGIVTRDEARAELGYEPIGGYAAELYIPSNAVPLGDTKL